MENKEQYSGEKIITISIAAYNMEKYLRETLDSFLIGEEMCKFEILIIDDGSTDATAMIAQEYEKRYPQCFRIISKENGGWGSTVNCSIENATGKYFKILDGDDYFDLKNLKEYLKFLEQANEDMVITPYKTFDDITGKAIHVYDYDKMLQMDSKTLTMPHILDECRDIEMHACTVKTDILKFNNIKLLEHCFYTDNEFLIKAYSHCNTVTYFPKCIYCYRVGRSGQSISPEGKRKHYKEHERVLSSMIQYVHNLPIHKEMNELLNIRITGLALAQYYTFFYLESTKQKKKELRRFDSWLKVASPDIYYAINTRSITFLRLTRFVLVKRVAYRIKKYLLKMHNDD